MYRSYYLMQFIEEQYVAVDEGRATLDQILTWVREANLRIESLIGPDNLKAISSGVGDDRYAIRHFS